MPEILPAGDEHALFDVRWRAFALAVLNDRDDEVLAAFEELEGAGRWTVAMVATLAMQQLIAADSAAGVGTDAVRRYLEVGVLEHRLLSAE